MFNYFSASLLLDHVPLILPQLWPHLNPNFEPSLISLYLALPGSPSEPLTDGEVEARQVDRQDLLASACAAEDSDQQDEPLAQQCPASKY